MMRFVLPIIFVAVAIGLYFGYIDTGFDAAKELRAEEARFDEALGKSKELQNLRDQLLTRYNSFPAADLERLQKMLPDNVDNVRLVLDLDGIASKYDLQIRSVTINRTSEPSSGAVEVSAAPHRSILLSFAVRASYEDFLIFLQDLETSLRLVDIMNVSFNAPSDDSDIYDFQVTMRTYWLE